MSKWTPQLLSLARIMFGFLLFRHGLEQVLGVPKAWVPADTASFLGLLKLAAFPGGVLVMLGLFTRPVCLVLSTHPLAFLLSGEMAFAYFINHAPEGFWGSFTEPNQEAAILNCYVFLFLSGTGAGALSLDDMQSRRRARIQARITETIA